MNLDIPKDQLEKIVSAAILAAVTPENRDTLIRTAIASLLEPKKDDYGRTRTTPLQDAFEWSVRVTAQEIVREELKTNAVIREQLRKLVHDAMTAVMSDEKYPGVVEAVANAISLAMTANK